MTNLDAAIMYAERGLAVFPCAPSTKIPLAGSSGCKDATTDVDKIRAWWSKTPTANVAIATGSVSGIYVVDIDAASSEIMPLLPETWIARTRSGGWHYVYRLLDGVHLHLPNTAKRSPNAIAPDVDSRGEGGYIIAYPSVVDGGTYEWINDVDPAPLPQWIIDRVMPRHRLSAPQARQSFSLVATSWAQQALRSEIDTLASTAPGGRNHALVRASFKLGQICAAGHLSFDAALNELRHVVEGWPSLRKSMSTIKRGIEAGARHPRSPARRTETITPYYLDDEIEKIAIDVESDDVDDASSDDAITTTTVAQRSKTPQEQDDERWRMMSDVRRLGGLCDSYCGWVLRGADHPQPGLTIASLIALGSALAGRRLIYRRSTSSMYVVALASSGEGKNRPQSCLSRVIDECWPALRGPNSFSSGAAFVDGVRKAVGAGVATCLVLDEYGMQLAGLIGHRASAHRQDVKQSLTELATKGTDKWSPAVSMIKGGGKLELIAPVVTVLGSTTPESLHAVITSTDVADGFIGRHMWMRSQSVLPEWQPPETRPDDDLPSDVRAAVLAIRERHEAWHLALPVAVDTGIDQLRIYDPMTMSEDEDARAALTTCKINADDARRRGTRADIPPAVLARLPEMATRIAMILAVLSKPECDVPVVTGACAHAAIAIAEESASVFGASLTMHRRASWDDHAAQCDIVEGAIRSAPGGIRRSALLRSCRAIPARMIDDIVMRLVDEGVIVVDHGQATTGRPYTMYRHRTA